MATRKITRNPWAIAAAAILGICIAMLVTFLATRALFPNDWIPTEAEVEATRIVSSREGALTWTLLADLTYQVERTRYHKSDFKILHRTERQDTRTSQSEWLVGKQFTVYVKSSDPQRISLLVDGGREALAVAAAVLTPAALILLTFAAILIKRSRQRSEIAKIV